MRRVAVDWDGTCVADDHWPEMGDWLPGAREALEKLAAEFDEVVIWTCRTADVWTDEKTPHDPAADVARIALMLDGLPPNVIVWTKPYKPPAEFYIDNKAIRFTDWDSVLEQVVPEPPTAEEVYASEIYGYRGPDSYTPSFYAYCAPSVFPQTYAMWDESATTSTASVRWFETGATRDTEDGKLDYEGFLSPRALRRYAEYMHAHRQLEDGTLRDSDNWQKGIPLDAYMKSGWRHFMDWWASHRCEDVPLKELEDAICALIFNAFGYLHEITGGEE